MYLRWCGLRELTLMLVVVGSAAPAMAQVSARAPAVDVHTHLGGVWDYPGTAPDFSEIQSSMAARNIAIIVDFKAGAVESGSPQMGIFGSRVAARIATYPDTSSFSLFANVPTSDSNQDFLGMSMVDFPAWAATVVANAATDGAAGIKLRYDGGGSQPPAMTYGPGGDVFPIDAPELEPMWAEIQQQRLPVLMHLGCAYLGGYDATDQGCGSYTIDQWFEILMLQRERVLRRFPALQHIGAHIGSAIGAFDYQDELLRRYPSYYCELFAHQDIDIFGTVDAEEQAFLERHQDQIVFGTDYMEATMGWLTSYLQRLDMSLPFIESWPISDPIFTKLYATNARRVLRLTESNTAPMAHPGFTQVVIIGDTVTLDGSASFDAESASGLIYNWSQSSGPNVALADAGSPTPSFLAANEATFVFELSVGDGATTGASRSVTVHAVPDGELFRENNGQVVIEAESYWKTIPRAGHSWTATTATAGYSGSGAIQATPDNGAVASKWRLSTDAPELVYKVLFATPGSYIVYLRGAGANADGDSVHIGLDGEEVTFGREIGPFPSNFAWRNERADFNRQTGNARIGLAVLNVAESGVHLINVWMHEDGFVFDKLVLDRRMAVRKTTPLYDPGSGSGPPESPTGSITTEADGGGVGVEPGDADAGGDQDAASQLAPAGCGCHGTLALFWPALLGTWMVWRRRRVARM